ncbi:MAG TPA: MoaD/ThiS family protein [Brevundimonas sp.]|uniref:MoaD/ThiS family protein n=1 Tax=Brevundimonas sp. TaxID=1871086 RepID=UPI0026396448|nr:MoaD/ThiS family protein [Brevundimonas sp.]HRO32114.1 MoaD/ThiS family protein [Brevundimonas sp.]
MRKSETEQAGPGIRVQFFGRPSDVFGAEQLCAAPAQGLTLGALRQRLAQSLAGEGGEILLDPSVRGGVDDQVFADSATVKPGQTVLFFSTFSGG